MSDTKPDNNGNTSRTAIVRLVAAYDRHVEHPEIYEDLKNE